MTNYIMPNSDWYKSRADECRRTCDAISARRPTAVSNECGRLTVWYGRYQLLAGQRIPDNLWHMEFRAALDYSTQAMRELAKEIHANDLDRIFKP